MPVPAGRRPRFRRLPRRRPRPAHLLLRLPLLLAVLWLAGFFAFTGWVFSLRPPAPMPHADGIVALTGGDSRIGYALSLLAAGDAPKLLISGAGAGTYLGDFTGDDADAATRFAGDIVLGHAASTTHTNAIEVAGWATARGMRSLIVVTADYHMPRALAEIARALPGVRLTGAPVTPPAMRDMSSGDTLRLLAGEYTKYLVVRAGFGGLAANLTAPQP